MQPENGAHRKPLKQAIVDHRLCAGFAFLGGLKDKVQHAARGRILCEMACCAEQHGGVPVVSARVHDAIVNGLVGEAGSLLYGKRVHIGAQSIG